MEAAVAMELFEGFGGIADLEHTGQVEMKWIWRERRGGNGKEREEEDQDKGEEKSDGEGELGRVYLHMGSEGGRDCTVGIG